jgi:hypothetical protein
LLLPLSLPLPLPLCCHPSAQREDLLFACPQFSTEKSKLSGRFLATRKPTINPPRFTTQFTTISPQKTTLKNPLFPKHPPKTPQNSKAPDFSEAPLFLQKAA